MERYEGSWEDGLERFDPFDPFDPGLGEDGGIKRKEWKWGKSGRWRWGRGSTLLLAYGEAGCECVCACVTGGSEVQAKGKGVV